MRKICRFHQRVRDKAAFVIGRKFSRELFDWLTTRGQIQTRTIDRSWKANNRSNHGSESKRWSSNSWDSKSILEDGYHMDQKSAELINQGRFLTCSGCTPNIISRELNGRWILVSIHHIHRFKVCCFSGRGGPRTKQNISARGTMVTIFFTSPRLLVLNSLPKGAKFYQDDFIDAVLSDFHSKRHELRGPRVCQIFHSTWIIWRVRPLNWFA
jgi:hypothetical protein